MLCPSSEQTETLIFKQTKWISMCIYYTIFGKKSTYSYYLHKYVLQTTKIYSSEIG